jgi:hypothetical protein
MLIFRQGLGGVVWGHTRYLCFKESFLDIGVINPYHSGIKRYLEKTTSSLYFYPHLTYNKPIESDRVYQNKNSEHPWKEKDESEPELIILPMP